MSATAFTADLFDEVVGGHLRGRGFDVRDFAIEREGDAMILSFVFNCPCGRPVREGFAMTRLLEMQVLDPTAFLSAMAKRAAVELQRHIDGEGN